MTGAFKWDRRFLGLAEFVSSWSRDPSTQVGAVIVRPDNRIVSLGFNGFPQGVFDEPERYEDRETKYRLTVHAECNAILFARQELADCTLYTWPFMPCARCAGMVIQSGIRRVVAPEATDELWNRWAAELDASLRMFHEAKVELKLYPLGDEDDDAEE